MAHKTDEVNDGHGGLGSGSWGVGHTRFLPTVLSTEVRHFTLVSVPVNNLFQHQ